MERGLGGEVIKKVIMKQKIFIFILILSLFAFLTTCRKDFEIPTGSNKIEFNNTTVDSVSYSWVQITTQFTGTGGNEILQHGYCWSTGQKPTIEDNKIELGSLDNQVNTQTTIDSLTNNTNYYIRFFLAYYGGILYGDEVNIKTLKTGTPLVLTSEVSEITLFSAVCGGTVLADSGLIVTARGICWDTISDFNIDSCLNKTINGDSLGTFTSNITELNEGKDYFVKAYATNEKGTAYGDIESFTTLDPPCGELIVSYGGQTYNTVLIGSQCWMKENLNIGTRIDGVDEQTDNSIIEKYCYGDDENNCDEYGGLYQWDEMMQYVTDTATQGICPDGWHIPTDKEWKVLEGTVDSQYPVGDPEWDNVGWRGFDAGYNLKSESSWNNNGNGTNSIRFTGLPGGFKEASSGSFWSLGDNGFWWSSSASTGSLIWERRLLYSLDEIGRTGYLKEGGSSVRCVKD